MPYKSLFLSILLTQEILSFSQPRLVTLGTHTNSDRSVDIIANCQNVADYTLKVIFSTLTGYTSNDLTSSNIGLFTISRGDRSIMRLTPQTMVMSPAFSYKYYFYPGRSFRKTPDTSFVYLIPASLGKQVLVLGNSSKVSKLSQQLGFNDQYRSTGFFYLGLDTICASRAGTVFEVSDTVTQTEGSGVIYRKGRNRISIVHRDGTIGNYAMDGPIKLLVSIGDEIMPGQPMAVFKQEGDRHIVYFSTCYLDERKLLAANDYENTANVSYNYMTTQFYGGENEKSTMLEPSKNYVAQHPAEIVSKEMSKKEKKKYGY